MRIRNRWIPFIFLMLSAIGMARWAHALDTQAWLSSNTSTADSLGTLCGQFLIGQTTVPAQGAIHAINISSGVAGTTLQLYDSSFTITSATSSLTIGPIMTTAVTPSLFYDIVFRRGLCYVKTGTATVQILYQCF